jgi:hypothetical protein
MLNSYILVCPLFESKHTIMAYSPALMNELIASQNSLRMRCEKLVEFCEEKLWMFLLTCPRDRWHGIFALEFSPVIQGVFYAWIYDRHRKPINFGVRVCSGSQKYILNGVKRDMSSGSEVLYICKTKGYCQCFPAPGPCETEDSETIKQLIFDFAFSLISKNHGDVLDVTEYAITNY